MMKQIEISCPECGQLSDSIKRYSMFDYFLFLFFAASHRKVTYTCCPSCMRKHIIKEGIFTWKIITANLLWLFLILPWSLILLLFSYTKGHSSSIQKILDNEYE